MYVVYGASSDCICDGKFLMAEFVCVMIILKWQRGHTGARMTGKLVR